MLIVVVAAAAPLLAPFPGDAGSATHPFFVLRPPSALHWFGTDQVGRDVLSRVIYGARISPLVAVIVLVIACVIGIPLGIVAGFLSVLFVFSAIIVLNAVVNAVWHDRHGLERDGDD